MNVTTCSEVHFKLPINTVRGLHLGVPYGLKGITLHGNHIRLSTLSSLTLIRNRLEIYKRQENLLYKLCSECLANAR